MPTRRSCDYNEVTSLGSEVKVDWTRRLEGGTCLGKTLASNFTSFVVEAPVACIGGFVADKQQLALRVRFHVISMNMGCDTMIPTSSILLKTPDNQGIFTAIVTRCATMAGWDSKTHSKQTSSPP